MVKIIKSKLSSQEVPGGNQISEKYSSKYPWIRYNFEYDPFQYKTTASQIFSDGKGFDHLNSMGYHSDEFTKTHSGKHVLFNGCSQTFGNGILHDENWTTKVLSHISKTNDVSGYYNIAYPARGIHNIIFETIKYCETYAKPDYIFICFPDEHRFFGKSTEDGTNKQYTLYPKVASDEDIDLFYDWSRPTMYQYYYMLEKYCESNNIKLLSFTWTSDTESIFKNFGFNTFYCVNEPRKYHYIYDYVQDNPEDKYALIARDDCHLGTGVHDYFSTWMSEEFDKSVS